MTDPAPGLRGAASRIAWRALYGSLLVLVLPPSLWLLLRAVTGTGRAIGVAGLLLALLPWCYSRWARRQGRSSLWRALSLALSALLLLVVGLVLAGAPDGRSGPGSPVSHQFSRPGSFVRYAPSNLMPEADQVNIGFLVMPALDGLLTSGQAERVSRMTFALYEQMERDPDFRRLGSAMGWAYADLTGQPFDAGHYYLYVPRNRRSGPLPALVFLHGSAGNFKVYTWAWSRLAERYGLAIIAPSFGFGQWDRPGGAEAALRALDHAAGVVAIDPAQVWLAGLSNGGLGVSRAAAAAPERFRGLIYLSPVLEPQVLASPAFLRGAGSRQALVITGAADERVWLAAVQGQVAQLREAGVAVEEIVYPGEDHFLFFSQLDPILRQIGAWMALTELP